MVKLVLCVLSVSLLAFLVPGIAVAAQTQPGWAVLVVRKILGIGCYPPWLLSYRR